MAVRTTVEIPEPLHERLRHRAEASGSSVQSLIMRALEETYTDAKEKKRVTEPFIKDSGKRGPRYPVNENPHDLPFS